MIQTHHLHLWIITTFNNRVPTPWLTNTTRMRPWENPGAHQKAGISHTWMCLDWKRRGIIPSEKHCREMELLGLSSEEGWTKGLLSTKATMLVSGSAGFNERVSFLKDKCDYKNILDSESYFSSWQKKTHGKTRIHKGLTITVLTTDSSSPGFNITLQTGTVWFTTK